MFLNLNYLFHLFSLVNLIDDMHDNIEYNVCMYIMYIGIYVGIHACR